MKEYNGVSVTDLRAGKYPFPSEQKSMKEKEQNSYGLALAKAIYFFGTSLGPSVFFKSQSDYKTYKEYGFGEQSEELYKPMLRMKPNQPTEDWVGSLRWGIKNYATKRLNIAVSKTVAREYDPIADPLDKNSIDHKAELRARIEAYMENKKLIDEISTMINRNFLPQEVDPRLVPDTKEDLDIWFANGFKLKQSSVMEQLIAHHFEKIRLKNIRRQLAIDNFLLGGMSAYVGNDSNVLPECFRCRPDNLIVPYSDREDFSDIDFTGYLIYPSVTEFIRMVNNSLSPEVISEIIEKKGITSDMINGSRDSFNQTTMDSTIKIPVMRFVKLSEDQKVFVERVDERGNERFLERNYNEWKTPNEQNKFKEKYGDSRTLHRPTFTSCYEGFWVVDSDYIFRYGRKNSQERERGKFAEAKNPFKFFAPNLHDGKTVSTMKQMIPVLDELQSYHIKKMHTIASAIPSGFAFNLNAIRNAKFKWNDKEMTDQQKITFFYQSGIIAFDDGGRNNQSSKPFYELKGGLSQDVITYVSLIQQALMELDEIIGFNKVTAASTLRADSLKGTAEIQERNSDVALDYMYNADNEIVLDITRSLGTLTIQSIRARPDYYQKIISRTNLKIIKEMSGYEYGFGIELRPTSQQWDILYRDAAQALANKEIGFDDYLDLQQFKNLKEARMFFKTQIRKRREEMMMMENNKIQGNIVGQRESNELAHRNAMELERIKSENEKNKQRGDKELKLLGHRLKKDEIEWTLKLQKDLKIALEDWKGDENIRSIIAQGFIDQGKIVPQNLTNNASKS